MTCKTCNGRGIIEREGAMWLCPDCSEKKDTEPRHAGAFIQPKHPLPGIPISTIIDGVPRSGFLCTIGELADFARLWFGIADDSDNYKDFVDHWETIHGHK